MIRVVIVIYILIISQCSFATGSTGIIIGTVLDFDNDQPVIGARVQIEGTTLGAMVNAINGEYIIMKVPANTAITLVASCIAYNPVFFDSIIVSENDTLIIDICMESQAIEIDNWRGCICTYSMIDRYEARSVIEISSREIKVLPTSNLQGILKYAGLNIDKNGSWHIRGSRSGEVGYIDDGVLIRDELGGH